MGCDVLNWKCIFVNEIAGSALMAILLFTLLYFIYTSKMRIGFDTTIFLGIPVILLVGYISAGFAVVYTFGALIGGILLGTLILRIIQVRF